jgi:hypothetical protein
VIWKWTSDGKFTVRSAYNALHIGSHPFQGCQLIWDTWAPLKVKIFMWLALRGRQWTADRRCRHGLDANEHCFLCDQEPATIDHIIVTCSFSQQVWWNVATALQRPSAATALQRPMVTTLTASAFDWWTARRQLWAGQERTGADSIFLLVAWEL